MRVISEIVILFSVFEGTVFAFGGKNVSDRANGAKVASASLIALAILAATAPMSGQDVRLHHPGPQVQALRGTAYERTRPARWIWALLPEEDQAGRSTA